MSCCGGGLDPDRTEDMEEQEHILVLVLQDMRAEYIAEHSDSVEESSDNGWIEKYVDRIKKQIEFELSDARGYIHENVEKKGSVTWKEVVHTFWRRTALYHQEMELIQQGVDIPLLAVHSDSSIGNGNRYAFIVFFKLSGYAKLIHLQREQEGFPTNIWVLKVDNVFLTIVANRLHIM